MLSWELPKEEEREVAEQVQPQKGYFSQVFDNLDTWRKAAYADTRQIGLDTDIKDTFDAINNHKYRSYEEYMALRSHLWDLVDRQEQYQKDFETNQKILDANKSELADLTQIGGTVHGIGTQLKDTLIGGATGALAYGLPAAAATGGVGAIPAAMVGAVKGATWANRYGALDQAYQDARLNAIDAWKTVLREGGNAEQAEQAYKDALINNLPTEALDAASSMYVGSKLIGKAAGSDFAKRVSKSALGKTAEKISRFDLPAKIATATAARFGSTAGKAVGLGLNTLENMGEEGIQEPWQDYATARAVDIQRRKYDPTHEGIRDFSVFGDGGLLDYYTTPEGKETAWKAAKMGAVFGSVGGVLTASENLKLGTANNDSIRAGEQIAKETSDGGILQNKINQEKKEEMRGIVGNLYDLSEEETANLSDKEVYRMWHDYWTNKLSTGGLFTSGNRQEVSAAVQADMINALTDEETNRMGLMNDTAKQYIDKYGMNPDGSILQHVNEQVQQQTQQQVEQQTEQQDNQEGVGIYAKGTEKTFGNTETNENQNDGEQQKRGYWDLPDTFDNAKQWERIDEGNDNLDYNEESYYKNNITGRIAHVLRVRSGKGYEYVVTDVTDKNNKGTSREQFKKIKFDSIKNVGKYLNTPHANKESTAFMSDSQTGNELAGIKQQLPKEDGVISDKDSQNDGKIWKDVNGNHWLNGKLVQSNKAEEIHTLLDLNKYYRENRDLMDADLYAEVARNMMRFGIGKSNNTSIVLDLSNEWSGARGSKTTWKVDPRDPNSAIAKAVVRLYAGADLVTAAHEVAHLGWINLSDKDKETFRNWAIDTEEKFVAQVLGIKYDDNFRAYLLEALTNQGVGGSQDSRVLWAKIQMQGATRQTIDILNNHRNAQNMADAIDERFAWEFSNWFAQGYIRGSEPRNVIERILQKACMSMGKALNLLADTKRYLDGDQSREVNRIFTNMSATKKDYGQVRQQQQPVVTSNNNIEKTSLDLPYDLSQGVSDMGLADEIGGSDLDAADMERQDNVRNIGTIPRIEGNNNFIKPQEPTTEQTSVTPPSPVQNIGNNTGSVPRATHVEKYPTDSRMKPVNYDTPNPQETLDQYRDRMKKQEEEDENLQGQKVAGYRDYKDSYIKTLVRGAFAGKSGYKENLAKIRQNVNPARLERIINEVEQERREAQEKEERKKLKANKSVKDNNVENQSKPNEVETKNNAEPEQQQKTQEQIDREEVVRWKDEFEKNIQKVEEAFKDEDKIDIDTMKAELDKLNNHATDIMRLRGYDSSLDWEDLTKLSNRFFPLIKRLNEIKDERQKAEQEKKEQERVNKIVDEVKDIDGVKNLSDEAKVVYYETYEYLQKNGNVDVRKVAQENAIIYARMCERLAQLHREAIPNDKDYTAKTVSDKIKLNVGGFSMSLRGGFSFKSDFGTRTGSDIGKVTWITNRMISVYNQGTPSTFMHESTHMYVFELEYLATEAPNSQAAKDFKALMDWAETRDEQTERKAAKRLSQKKGVDPYLDDYFNTPQGDKKEFGKLKLKHEKIAIAFEEYLRSGKAPTKELKGVFERFKSWIINFYNDLKTLSLKPNKEIVPVFNRMILTDKELSRKRKKSTTNNNSSSQNKTSSSDTKMQENSLSEKEQRNLQILQQAFPDTKFQVSMAGHASRVNFPKFLLSYLGSGVGDQVHGWGLYFSLIPETVKKYFNVFDGQSFGSPEDMLEKMKIKNKADNTEVEYTDFIEKIMGDALSKEEQVAYLTGEGQTVIDSLDNRLFDYWLNDATNDQPINNFIKDIAEEILYNEKDLNNNDLSDDIKDYIEEQNRELKDLKEFLENYVDKNVVFSFPKQDYKDNRTIYHVAIPDIKDMLNEHAKLKDQSKRIQKQAIKSFIEVVDRIERSPQGATHISRLREGQYGGLSQLIAYDTFGENNNSTLIGKLNKKALLNFTGKEFYDELVHALHYSIPLGEWDSRENRTYAKEAVSKTLLKNGIQGISYIGKRDGLCAVVFNEDAVKIVSKFQQEEGKWKKLEVEKDTETENREKEAMRKKALEKRNRKQDTKMQEDSVEDTFAIHSVSKDNKTTTMRRYNTGKTIDGTPIPKGDKTLIPVRVGKQMEKNVYFHKDYADRIVPKDKLEKAKAALKRDFPDFKYNCMMYNIKTGLVRFDEAPKFDTAREPITGRNITVNPDTGHTLDSKGNRVKEKQIWHHKWMWVMDDYKGFNVQESKEWSQRWLKANEGKGSPSGWVEKWNNKLDELGLPQDDNTTAQDTKMQVESVEGLEQDGSSAGTSRKQVAAMFKKINWEKGTVNADIGGGKYDLMTEYVKERGVENIVFDPGNRTLEHNRQAVEKIQHRVDTVTVANVLNVLPSIKDMKNVILQAAECLKPNGKAYFLMYEGDGKNKNKLTEVKKGQWQQNKPQKWYRPLLEERFGKENVEFKNGFYTCTNPIIKEGEKGVWSLDDTFKDNNVTLTYDDIEDNKLQGDSYNTVELNVETLKDPDTEAFVRKVMEDNGVPKTRIDEIFEQAKGFAKKVEGVADKYPSLDRWNKKKAERYFDKQLKLYVPILNAFRSNGDYFLNVDLGTICVKRLAADALNTLLKKMGLLQNLGATQFELLKAIMKKHGFLTACDICFNETKRAMMRASAERAAYDWESVLEALGLETNKLKEFGDNEEYFNSLSKEKIKEINDRLKEMSEKKTYKQAYEKYMPKTRQRSFDENDKQLDNKTTADKMQKIAKLMRQNNDFIGKLNPDLLMSSEGMDILAKKYGGRTRLVQFLSGIDGSATAKLLLSSYIYDPLSWAAIPKKSNGYFKDESLKRYLGADNEGNVNLKRATKSLYDDGGIRIQSFTDFTPDEVIDYMQFIIDCEARHLPAHTYTKVPTLVEIFNKTRMMINMSFVPEIIIDLKNDELDEHGKLKHAGLKYNPKTGKFDLYAWHEDSFPIELGYEYRKKYDYAGTIAVGVSDAHIRKMMADPEIDMIIPYHKSGMPKTIQIKTGLQYAKDYTKEQSLSLSKEQKAMVKEKYKQNWDVYLNYSRILFEKGDPREAAKEYVRRCREDVGVEPIFAEFANEDGYYKVLEDFRGYDTKDKPILQKPVRFELAEDWFDKWEKAMKAYGKIKEQVDNMKNNKPFMDEVLDVMSKQRLDGELRDVMIKRMNIALGGGKKVLCVNNQQFFDELEKSYNGNMPTEDAKNRVQKFRDGDFKVYGFAQGDRIVLNENYFNANTPAHEFVHVWAKVAQNYSEESKELWRQGVELLSKHEMWKEVVNDELYRDIKNDDNAVASEVLARLVGKANEDYVRKLLDPNYGQSRGSLLLQQIKDWCTNLFNKVRSIFDGNTKKKVTFDEFVKMPLKAIWEEKENQEFGEKSKQVLKKLNQLKQTTELEVNNSGSDTKMQLHSEEGMQKADINTPAFKEWFKGSILKNKDGTPQVLYRGMRNQYDPTFDKEEGNAVWLAVDRDVAESYRDTYEVDDVYKGKPYHYIMNGAVGLNEATGDLMEVYASIKTPFDFGEISDSYTNHEVYMNIGEQLKKDVANGTITQEQMKQVLTDLEYLNKKNKSGNYPSGKDRVWKRFANKKLFKALKAVGYDSIKALEDGNLTYGILDRGNVKSIYNQGTWDKSNPDTRMQGESIERPLNQQRAITILDGKFDGGEAINFVNEILDHKKKGETRTTRTLTRKENLGITNDKKNVVGVIRLGEPRLLKKYEVDENGNIKLDKDGNPIKTQDYIDSMIEGTDYDIDDNNLAKNGKPKYFYPITVLKDYRKNPKKITKHVSQAYKEYDGTDTKTQASSTDTYLDKEKDIYSVTFTKSAQKVAENQKKMKHYRDNDSYWRENPNKDGSITFVRALPYKHHTKTIIYDDIDGKKVSKRPKAKALEYLEVFKDKMVKWFFNDKHFLYKAAKQIGALDSYMRMMVMKDQGAVAGAAIEDGIVKHNGKNGERTKSLNSIIEAVGEENQIEFLKYCEAFRALDLYNRKILQKMTSEDDTLAKQIIEDVKNSKNADLFEEQRKNFVEYNHELLWVLVDGGFITEETYNKLVANDPNFVPLAKNFDELEGYVDSFGNSRAMININNPLHKIKTSFREVKNPFLEMQKRTVEYYVKASRNKAGMIFVNDIAKAIAKSANGDIVAMNQGMVRKLKSRDKNGVPIRADSMQNVFYIWNNGEKEYYQVADREIYAALKSFDAEQMSALKKIVNQTAGRASRLVRNTATMTPDFGLRNLCRDTVEAFISSQHGFIPIIDSLWGMYQMANDTQWYREYQRMNGEPLNTLNRGGGEEDIATVEHGVKDNIKLWKTYAPLRRKDYREFMDKDRSMTARAKSLLLLATDVIGLHSLYKANKRLNDYLETGTRIGEYRNARMGYHGLSGRLFGSKVKGNRIFTTDKDLLYATHDEMFAAYKSKDVTLNFGQHGSIGKELNHYIPFFNASLQGIYKIFNTIDEMVRGNDTRIKQELWFKCILFSAMGMAAALAGADDDDYIEAPEWEHENFWIFPSGIRIAKDQLFGRMIAGTVEKATRQYLRDGDIKKKELLYDVLGNFVIDKCTPAVMDMWLGTWGNYDTFRKQAVVPEYMERKGMYGYLKKDLSTSTLAGDISEALLDVLGIDVAAKKVDFFLQKTLSNTGNYARNLYELGFNKNEKMTRGAEKEDKGGFAEWSKELPYPMNTIVGTFATNRNTFQSISDFYDRYRELQTKSSAPERMSKEEAKAWKAYEAAYKKDKSYRNKLRAIKQNSSLSGAQKREMADKIFKQQISMSRKLREWERKHGLI